jgi:hypothetical protein
VISRDRVPAADCWFNSLQAEIVEMVEPIADPGHSRRSVTRVGLIDRSLERPVGLTSYLPFINWRALSFTV